MSTIQVKLEEGLKTQGRRNGKSGIVRTAFNEPREEMNPGELLANALGACMLTMIGFLAARRGENLEGTEISLVPGFDEKHSRVTQFAIEFHFPEGLTQTQKDFYAKAAESCPVHHTLKDDISYKITVK